MTTELWIAVGVGCLLNGIAGGVAANARGGVGAGFLAGLFLGPFGVVAALGLDYRPQCPRCAGRLDGPGRVCQHCRVALAWPHGGGPPKVATSPEPTTKDGPPRFTAAPDAAEEWAAAVLNKPQLPPLR